MNIDTFLKRMNEIKEHVVLRYHDGDIEPITLKSSRYYPLAITWKKDSKDGKKFVYIIYVLGGHLGNALIGILRAEYSKNKELLKWQYVGDALKHPWAEGWLKKNLYNFSLDVWQASVREVRIADELLGR